MSFITEGTYIKTPHGYKLVEKVYELKLWQKVLLVFGIEVIKIKLV